MDKEESCLVAATSEEGLLHDAKRLLVVPENYDDRIQLNTM